MKKILFGFLIISTLFSCQKEIDVDLNEVNPQVVIEANYTAEDSTVRVRISLTSNYFDTAPSETVNNAVVTITDMLGASQNIISKGNGEFELLNYIPLFNTTYTLNVAYNGTNYSAQCDMKIPVDLNDITFEYFPSFFGGDDGYLSHLNFQDPAEAGNRYLVLITRNGVVKDKVYNFILQDDKFTNGNLIERPLFIDSLFNSGDVIGMELRSIDDKIFYYYSELISISSGQSSAAPANPENNWDNKALGYFSAYSNSRKEAIVP